MKIDVKLAFALCFLAQNSECCFGRFFSKSREKVCKDVVLEQNEQCSIDQVTETGRGKAIDLAVGLYKSVAMEDTINQENLMIFPSQVSSVLSVLMMADDTQGSSTLQQLQCHIDDFNRFMFKSNLVVLTKGDSEFMRLQLDTEGEASLADVSKDVKKVLHGYTNSRIAYYSTYFLADVCCPTPNLS